MGEDIKRFRGTVKKARLWVTKHKWGRVVFEIEYIDEGITRIKLGKTRVKELMKYLES